MPHLAAPYRAVPGQDGAPGRFDPPEGFLA